MAVWYNKQPKKCLFKTVEELDRHRQYMLGLPLPHISGPSIPWGYTLNEGMLEPIDECFVLLVEAKHLMSECTYQELSDWLTTATGHNISPWGLQKIMQDRQPDDRAALPRNEREKI